MSRTNVIINKSRSIEKVLNGEKKFYAEYNSKVVITKDKPTRIPQSYSLEWVDHRPLGDKVNKAPHIFYVALGERYESDTHEKYFMQKDKAEAYAYDLYEEHKDLFDETEYWKVITEVLPLSD